jgi:hypothetical protein
LQSFGRYDYLKFIETRSLNKAIPDRASMTLMQRGGRDATLIIRQTCHTSALKGNPAFVPFFSWPRPLLFCTLIMRLRLCGGGAEFESFDANRLKRLSETATFTL